MGIRSGIAHADRSSNASSAKIIGVITICAAALQFGAWGIVSASLLTAAGLLLIFGAGDELRRISLRNAILVPTYWFLVLIGVGAGVT